MNFISLIGKSFFHFSTFGHVDLLKQSGIGIAIIRTFAGLIPKFLEMVRSRSNRHHNLTRDNVNPRVYVNTIFEMKTGLRMPEDKKELLAMLATGDAVPFHVNVCPACHLVPKYQEWKTTLPNDGELPFI